jgi:hypothetical protein
MTLVEILWYLNTAATIALIVRLYRIGLSKIYRWLWWFLVVNAAESLLRIPLSERSRTSADLYVVARMIGVFLSIMVIRDVYRRVLAGYPAVARFAGHAVGYLVGGACLISGLGLFGLPILGPGRSHTLYYMFALERTSSAALSLFLLGLGVFVTWMAIPVSRNTALLTAAFGAYHLARWAALVGVAFRPGWLDAINAGLFLFITGGLTIAAVRVSIDGEIVRSDRRPWSLAHVTNLRVRLEEIDTLLAGLGWSEISWRYSPRKNSEGAK